MSRSDGPRANGDAAIAAQGAVILVLGSVVGWDMWVSRQQDLAQVLLFLCWVNNIAFVLQLALLRRTIGGFWNPIVLSSVFLFLFTSGQLVLHSFGVAYEPFDLFRMLSLTTLRDCIRFVILGFAAYQFGVLLAVRRGLCWRIAAADAPHDESVDPAAMNVGLLLVLVGVIPYGIYLYTGLSLVMTAGYRAYYALDAARLNSGVVALGYYLLAGLVLIVVGGRPQYKRAAAAAIVIIALARLAAGDRGGGFAMLLSVYLLHATFIARRVKTQIIWGIIMILGLMYAVSVLAAIRGSYAQGLDVLSVVSAELARSNPLTSTLGTLGGTLFPLARVMELVPVSQDFIAGGSYLGAIVLLLPRPFRIGVFSQFSTNPLLASPATWLMGALGMTYGPGFTPFAEGFLNFGWWGLLALCAYGLLMGRLVSPDVKGERDAALARGLGILAFLLLAMASRSSMNYVVTFYVRYVLVPYLLVVLVRRSGRKRRLIAAAWGAD